MGLDRGPGCGIELTVQVGGDVAPGSPAAKRLLEARPVARIVGGEGAHEHHPATPQPLLGGRQADAQGIGDLGSGPAQRVVKDDRHAEDDGQPGQRVLQIVAQLGPLQDPLRRDGPGVVGPLLLDGCDVELIVTGSRAVDDAVDEGASKPAPERGWIAKLVIATPGGDQRLLRTVLCSVDVPGQTRGQAYQPGQLGQQDLAELARVVGLSRDASSRIPRPSASTAGRGGARSPLRPGTAR